MVILTLPAWGQYPQNYFQSPLGIPLYLAGNFGEFRPNHFHTGLDFKTNQVENLPVYAVAEGYVSRIAVSHSGYGYCLYINHPNGYTSVYAHLNAFDERISAYLLTQQRAQEKWNVDITVDSGLLVYQKGDQIALSGNSGGSVAPHLHFEIRNTATQKVINAMYFGFDIKDGIPPIIKKVGLYDANKSVYQQTPQIKTITELNSGYVWKVNTSFINLGVVAEDFMNNSTNTLGVYKTKLYVDDELIFHTDMDELDFAHNRAINGFTDYKYRSLNNEWMHLLYQSQNNELSFYKQVQQNKGINLSNGEARKIKIELYDYLNNKSDVQFLIQYDKQHSIENPQKGNSNLPQVYAHRYYKFVNDGYGFYEPVDLKIDVLNSITSWSKVIMVHDKSVPLAHPQELYVKLLKPLPFDLYDKLVFKHEVKAQSLPGAQVQLGMKATLKEGYVYAKIKTLGQYYVAIDTAAPQIKVLENSAKQIAIQVTEETTNISSFKAYLNDRFVVFSRKGNVFTSDVQSFYERNGVLKVMVKDENENGNSLTLKVSLD